MEEAKLKGYIFGLPRSLRSLAMTTDGFKTLTFTLKELRARYEELFNGQGPASNPR